MQYVTPGDMPLKQRPVAEQGRLFHESSIMIKEEKKKKKQIIQQQAALLLNTK